MRDRIGRGTWLLACLTAAVLVASPSPPRASVPPQGPLGGHPGRGRTVDRAGSTSCSRPATQRDLGQRDRRIGPGDPRASSRRRVAHLRADAAGHRGPPEGRDQPGPQDLHSRPDDDGLRCRRPEAIPRGDRLQRRMDEEAQTQAGLDLQRQLGPAAAATTRTPSTPSSASTPPARPASPSGRRLGPARRYWERTQNRDGGWALHARRRRSDRQHDLRGDLQPDHHRPETVPGAARPRRRPDPQLRQGGRQRAASSAAIDWLAGPLSTSTQNIGNGQQWHHYYLYGLERAGRLSGRRFFGEQRLVSRGGRGAGPATRTSCRASGAGPVREHDPVVATSFALLFLAKGRRPGPGQQAPPRSGRRLEQRPRRHPQPRRRRLPRLEAPAHLAGRRPRTSRPSRTCCRPRSSTSTATKRPCSRDAGKKQLRDFVEQGGFIFAEACCGRREFDQGFRALMKRGLPRARVELHPLAEDHAVWRAEAPARRPTSTRSGGSSTAAGRW